MKLNWNFLGGWGGGGGGAKQYKNRVVLRGLDLYTCRLSKSTAQLRSVYIKQCQLHPP